MLLLKNLRFFPNDYETLVGKFGVGGYPKTTWTVEVGEGLMGYPKDHFITQALFCKIDHERERMGSKTLDNLAT